jgi:hypothetical protein
MPLQDAIFEQEIEISLRLIEPASTNQPIAARFFRRMHLDPPEMSVAVEKRLRASRRMLRDSLIHDLPDHAGAATPSRGPSGSTAKLRGLLPPCRSRHIVV